MVINDISSTDSAIVFDDLDVEDYFITTEKDAIWRKLNRSTAIQITDNNTFLMARVFNRDVTVTKIEITSIEYRKIK